MTCDEDRLVLIEQALQLVEVDCLGAGFAPHDFLCMKLGYLRAKYCDLGDCRWCWFADEESLFKLRFEGRDFRKKLCAIVLAANRAYVTPIRGARSGVPPLLRVHLPTQLMTCNLQE